MKRLKYFLIDAVLNNLFKKTFRNELINEKIIKFKNFKARILSNHQKNLIFFWRNSKFVSDVPEFSGLLTILKKTYTSYKIVTVYTCKNY